VRKKEKKVNVNNRLCEYPEKVGQFKKEWSECLVNHKALLGSTSRASVTRQGYMGKKFRVWVRAPSPGFGGVGFPCS
jgi:hypothetical protein